MNRKFNLFITKLFGGIILIILFPEFSRAQNDTCAINLTDPSHDGVGVGKEMFVQGTASIPSGLHLWVLIHRINFKSVWWPQGEGEINPKTHEWKVSVTFGERRDIGWDFSLMIIVVNEKDHLILQNYIDNAMATGEFRPIQSPPSICPPKLRTVKKVSDN